MIFSVRLAALKKDKNSLRDNQGPVLLLPWYTLLVGSECADILERTCCVA
jgi:hypothetical protein